MEEISDGIKVVSILKKIMGVIRQRMENHFKEMNLTGPQGMLIGILAHYGEMKVSDLSERLGLSNSTVSGIVDRLENHGLVQRRRSKEDRRVVYISVTETYRENFRMHFNDINKMFEEILDKATPEEIRTIFDGLNTLSALMESSKD